MRKALAAEPTKEALESCPRHRVSLPDNLTLGHSTQYKIPCADYTHGMYVKPFSMNVACEDPVIMES